MKRPSCGKYQRAVVLAREAIREAKNAPPIRADRSPQAVLAKMQARAEKGEALDSGAVLAAMAAAMAEQESGKRRGRGRPKGARADGYRALRAAIWALHDESGLQPYRNVTGPRLSQCDAIAEAMKAEGFRTLNSYDAARREMVALRKSLRGGMVPVARHWQAIQRDISRALKPLGRQMQEMGRAFAALAKQSRARAILQPGTLPALFAHIRAQTTLSPETRRAIEKVMKTRR
ncbi:hypothetical protein KY389_11845 [Paracoccus bogoriensis]|uniref:hypothetical protein n=1 Tax=Paracoccus bogoriensis TaxID=242065 RepID=UPI001CA4967A|nr:hypothetical protein [Paracoccus bogoriensis]MBW7057378.1 hypothetical protein [Paracoccus bogoriensis]